MTAKSTIKPSKPYPEFPLFAHTAGQWGKKIEGKIKYFGVWDDPEAALRAYKEYIGEETTPTTTGITKPSDSPTSWRDRIPKVPKNFPLTAVAPGRWAKTINGRRYYFGTISDPTAALMKYQAEKDDLAAGRVPESRGGGPTEGLTLGDLVNRFLHAKQAKLNRGQLVSRSYKDYERVAKRLIKHFGPNQSVEQLKGSDFDKFAQTFPSEWSLITFRNCVRDIKCIFNFAVDPNVRLIERPVPFGTVFVMPSRKDLRIEASGKPDKFFNANEITQLLRHASPNVRAMIYLGINCGLGTKDMADLETSMIDFENGWLNFPRAKTGIERRCPLWQETITALQGTQLIRPQAALEEFEKYVFLTQKGNYFYLHGPSLISNRFKKLLQTLDLYTPTRGFNSMRHVFQTIGEESGEDVATSKIMGHAADARDMSSHYRELVADHRLLKVTNYVHGWLFGDETTTSKPNLGSVLESAAVGATA